MYVVAYNEVLATALPGRVPKEAPRFSTVRHEVETNELSMVIFPGPRMVDLRAMRGFSDHRGLRTATLTRSQTVGDDNSLNFRVVVVDYCCHIHKPAWLTVGWAVLSKYAHIPRDYFYSSTIESSPRL